MKHQLLYTDYEISEEEFRARKAILLPYSYDGLDDALGKARQIKERGGVPWEIVLPDGGSLDRRTIARILRDRGHELVGRPKVH